MEVQDTTRLLPDFKQVEEFGPDENYEEEDEVCYVTLDVSGAEPSLLSNTTDYRLIGLDTATPFLQLSGTIFKGRHDSLLGTELFFTEPIADGTKLSFAHAASTSQRIFFHEVTLQPKNEDIDPDLRPATRPSKEKKGKANSDGWDLGRDPEALDRMTGKSTPPEGRPTRSRRSRKGKEKAADPGDMDVDGEG